MLTDLSDALLEYTKAVQKYKEAFESCQEDASYFLDYEKKKVERTEAVFIAELKKRLNE